MKKTLFILAVLMLAPPAFAATPQKPAPEPNDLGITPQDCQQMVEYHTPPGVDYQPGVDAAGKPVVPADITPSPVTLPKSYSFTLNVDAAHYLGLTVPPGTQGLMPVGNVTLDQNGNASWNGQPMEGEALKALKAWCAAHPPETPDNVRNDVRKPAK